MDSSDNNYTQTANTDTELAQNDSLSIQFNSPAIQLKKIIKPRAMSLVWQYYGVLYCGSQIVSAHKDFIFCRKCFDKKIAKR